MLSLLHHCRRSVLLQGWLLGVLLLSVMSNPARALANPNDQLSGGMLSQPETEQTGSAFAVSETLPAASPRFLFMRNTGLTDPRARFVTRGPGLTAFFTDRGFRLAIERRPLAGIGAKTGTGDDEADSLIDPRGKALSHERTGPDEDGASLTHLLFTFEGSAEKARPEGLGPSGATINAYRGRDPDCWASGIPTFEAVIYRDLYPGIDLEVRGSAGTLQLILVLSSEECDLPRVRFHVAGARNLSLDPAGILEVKTTLGTEKLAAPRCHRHMDRGPVDEIACRYRLIDATHFGIRPDDLTTRNRDALRTEPTRDLSSPVSGAAPQASPGRGKGLGVSGPGLVWATYLGGSGDDGASAITLDEEGCIYVTGWSSSFDFPTTPGAYDRIPGGADDVFLAKLDPTGTRLIYATYLGGTENDRATTMALADDQSIVLGGWTGSDDFPVTPGAYDGSFGGGADWKSDGFAAHIDAAGGRLLLATYLGGAGDDFVYGIALGDRGELLMTGTTHSADFPTTPGALDESYNGGGDAFLAKLDPAGRSLLYGTVLGGIALDEGADLEVRPSGEVWLTGRAFSVDFPTTLGSYDDTYNGSYDIFVTKLDATSTSIVYSTFIGGIRRDEAWALALGRDETVYLTGVSRSPNFPVTPGAYDTQENGQYDAVVVALDPTGSDLIYATYLGGENIDYTRGIAVDRDGSVVVAGRTWSALFPTTPGAEDISFNGFIDAFIAKLDPTGSNLSYATFLGGPADDFGIDVCLDDGGSAYTVGVAHQSFPVSPGSYDPDWNGGRDAFLARVDMVSSCPADWSNFGSGWPGSHGVPSFTCRTAPVLCRTLQMEIGNSSGIKTLGTLLIGFSPVPDQPPWGHLIQVIPWRTVTIRMTRGVTTLDVDLPCENNLCGLELFLQVLHPDSGALHGVAATPGLRLVLGG